MKRRDFLNLTAGSALAAVVPLPKTAFARPIAQAPRNLYIWAVAMARAGNPISEKTLSKALKVSSEQADLLIDRLVSKGVVGAPNALGVAQPKAVVFDGTRLSSRPASNRTVRKTVQTARDALLGDQEDVSNSAETETNKPDVGQNETVTISVDDCAPQEVSDAARSTE
ncbi:hypothetical protein MWU54_14540 [Marivita sp. S6314]|uniref:hypothetical protein n=1 Tax=Marivita sp. S6314 TaxID=2926406 RepID=UPI001FF302EB|nr:hypothetical protein [Marivita sp. S6314]MCK0151256.1 hypothetical protein [Marivita sp. S6314]